MAPRRIDRTSSSSTQTILTVLFLLLLVGGGTGATLWATGFFDAKAAPSREGQIAFPALVRPVKAYEAITRDDLLHPETRQLNVTWLPENQTNPAMLRDLKLIVGRVVRRDKQAGSVLTERDTFPEGTRPGVTAGVPTGKRSVSITVDRVPGLELLRQGDHFDLLAALPQRKDPQSNIEAAALLGGIKPPDTRSGQLSRQTGIKPLVLAGTMVALTQGKSQSTGGSQGLTVPPASNRNRGSQSIVATVAVDPEEVAPLTEALGLDVDLFCVARSGLPDDAGAEEKSTSLEGLVPVVTTSRSVSAFAALGPEDMADPVTGRLNIYYFPPDQVQPDWVTTFELLRGRVVTHRVDSGSVLSQRDLLAPGTRPGITAAAPPGMSAVPITVSAIEGLDRLRQGDQFAVYAHLAVDQRPSFPLTDWAALQGAVRSPDDEKLEADLRRGVRRVVQQAVLLEDPIGPEGQAAALVIVAVPPPEVTALAQAIESGQKMYVAAISGLENTPTEEGSDWNHEPAPRRLPPVPAAMTMVSHLQDSDRESDSTTDADHVAVPVTARKIKAFERLAVEDFIDPATGRPRILLFPKDRVGDDWETDLNRLIDRVVRKEIEPGRSIRNADLLPLGSQAGPTAGIPEGMMGIALTGRDARGLDGIQNWQRGDRFQLVVARPYNVQDLGGTVQRGLTGGDALNQALTSGGLFDRADVQVLSASALLVDVSDEFTLTEERVTHNVNQSSQTVMTPAGPVRSESTQRDPVVQTTEVKTRTYLLAVAPSDVAAISEAVSTRAGLLAVSIPGVASGSSPPAGKSSVPPQPIASLPRPRIIEHVRGRERSRDVWVTPVPTPTRP